MSRLHGPSFLVDAGLAVGAQDVLPGGDRTNQQQLVAPEMKAVIMDQEAIKNEETKAMQSARDDAQRVLQAAERVRQTAEQNVEVMRTVAIVAVAGLVLVAVVHAIRGKHH